MNIYDICRVDRADIANPYFITKYRFEFERPSKTYKVTHAILAYSECSMKFSMINSGVVAHAHVFVQKQKTIP